jgi:GntR family transcriptional regulator
VTSPDGSRRDTVYRALREAIHSGKYASGERIPSEETIARELHASRATVRDALSRLEVTGLVVRRHGSGTYVAPRAAVVSSRIDRVSTLTEVIIENGLEPEIVDWKVVEVIPPLDIATDLALGRTDRTWAVSRTYLASGAPAAWCLGYVPLEWHGRRIGCPTQPSELRWHLQAELEVIVTHVVATIEAAPATGEYAEALRVPLGTPLLLNRNLNLVADGSPLMVGLSYSDSRVIATRLVQSLGSVSSTPSASGMDDRVSKAADR